MKKLFYLLFMLPLAFLASCSSDDDFPEVDLTFTLSGVTQYDDAFYAVRSTSTGETEEQEPLDDSASDEEEVKEGVIIIDGLTAKSLTNQNAAVANAVYWLDGRLWLQREIPTAILEPGTHIITIEANVLQVDKTLANVQLRYPVNIVASAEDLPADAPEIGTYSITTRIQAK